MTRTRWPLTAIALRIAAELLVCQWASGAEIPREAVCLVTADDGGSISKGSGTLVDVAPDGTEGLVVTCRHVIRDAVGQVTCNFGGRVHVARIVASDEAGDLAALAIRRPPVAPAALGLLDAQTTIAGYANGRTWKEFTGARVGQAQSRDGNSPSVVIDGTTIEGMSGGPAFNSRGEWCGVVWGSVDGESYVSSMPQVAALLTKCRVDTAALGVDQTQMICTPSGCRPSGRVVIGSPPLAPAASSPRRECACEGLASRLDTFETRIEALLTVQETLSQRIDEIELQPGPRGERGPQGPAGQDGRPGRDATIDDQLIDAIVQRVIDELPPITVNNADYHTGETLSSKQVRLGETLTLRFGQGDAQPAK